MPLPVAASAGARGAVCDQAPAAGQASARPSSEANSGPGRKALAVARRNAANHAVNVQLVRSDWYANVDGQFDLIVSNPPYIAENDEHLKQGDLRFEPITALASGEDGLNDIRHIIKEASNYLNPHGWLMLEHGYDQAEKVAELLTLHGFEQISHASDLSGTLRVTLGRMPQ